MFCWSKAPLFCSIKWLYSCFGWSSLYVVMLVVFQILWLVYKTLSFQPKMNKTKINQFAPSRSTCRHCSSPLCLAKRNFFLQYIKKVCSSTRPKLNLGHKKICNGTTRNRSSKKALMCQQKFVHTMHTKSSFKIRKK